MRRLTFLTAIAPFCLGLMGASPEPAKPIELQPYSGRWFEVARLHNKVEEDCAGAEASYTPTPDGGYRVMQTCIRGGGLRPKVYHPSMKVLDPGTNAREVLDGSSVKLKHGWRGVVNRGQADINSRVRLCSPGMHRSWAGVL